VNNLGWIWLILILFTLVPVIRQRQLEMERIRIMRQLEKKRGSRFISMIHRQEALAFFGLPLSRYINIEDSEQVLRAIRMTPDDMPLDLLLHTPGGLVLASEQIARALRRHPAKVTVFVPHYAMSGGTLVALAADEIVMDENAVLGPLDPQVGNFPAVSVLKAVDMKPRERVDDETLILADIAAKAMSQVKASVLEVLKERLDEEKAEFVADYLTDGHWTHDYPITCEELARLGLPVCGALPEEIYKLMDYYPQPSGRRPSIQYVPLPYRREKGA
jgi:ClpP class serine protease